MSKRSTKYDRAAARRMGREEAETAMADMTASGGIAAADIPERVIHTAPPTEVPSRAPAPPPFRRAQPWEWQNPALEDIRRERAERAEAARRRLFHRRMTVALCAALIAALVIVVMAKALATKVPAGRTAAAVAALPVLTLQVLVDEPREAVGIDENALIEAALLEQGYLSNAVPLDFTLQDVAQTACAEFGVPYPLALAVMEQESGFQTDVISPSGCYGLMQLNPDYFPSDLTPAENIRAGVAHLGELLARHGDTGAALTAYNAGHDTGNRTYADAVLSAEKIWDGQVGCTS